MQKAERLGSSFPYRSPAAGVDDGHVPSRRVAQVSRSRSSTIARRNSKDDQTGDIVEKGATCLE